jgi:exopolyphosphatase / guanosine-5'-triphosphate,3'-diphosphate pyrophosphatase
MRIGVVDVGSNTARLLVAEVDGTSVREIERDRRYLRLGDDVHAFGEITPTKLRETSEVAGRFARTARRAGVERLRTIVTAPGRQAANGADLVRLLETATESTVAQLSGDDEGRLAWEGAVASAGGIDGACTTIDLGGGSFEIAVGTVATGPEWLRSIDAGALRVSRTYLDGTPPTAEDVVVARQAIRRDIASLEPPSADEVLVVGGTARAIARVIGPRFDGEQLEGLAATLLRIPLGAIVASHGITPERARTLLGGTLVLLELAHELDAELRVVRGGVREGAALALVRSVAVAA